MASPSMGQADEAASDLHVINSYAIASQGQMNEQNVSRSTPTTALTPFMRMTLSWSMHYKASMINDHRNVGADVALGI